MPALLADGAGSPGATVAEWLLVGTVFLAWLAFARLRNRAFLRLPRVLGWGSAGLAVGTLVLALVLFPLLSPGPNGSARPASTARLLVVSPRSGQVVRGNPAPVPVRLLLVGGRIVPFTSTHLVPNTGHIHVYLDGNLIVMTTVLHRVVPVLPGHHVLSAEFVAVDHLPFDPRIRTSVAFDVRS